MLRWDDLSGETRAAIVGAFATAFLASLPPVRRFMIRAFCIRTLEKLEAARKQVDQESRAAIRTRLGGPIDADTEPPSIPLERLAQKAAISLWRAKYATRWNERQKKYGPF